MSGSCFHAHFTLGGNKFPDLTGLPIGTKTTVIDLEHGELSQRDVMLTRYYRGNLEDSQGVLDKVKADAREIAYATNTVLARAKLEFMGDFECELNALNYMEAHIKTAIPEADFAACRDRLKTLAELHDFRLSTNPHGRKSGVISQFANIRIRDGSAAEGRARIEAIQDMLASEGFNVRSTHIELTVWDSNGEHDAWWA